MSIVSLFSRARANAVIRLGSLLSRTHFLSLARVPNDTHAVANQRLEELLTHANEKVAFYRGRIPIRGGTGWGREALAQLPVLEKEDVECHFPDEITDDSESKDWRLMSTRGTAQRLITIHDFIKRDAGRAAWMRTLLRAGGYKLGMRKVEIPPEVCEIVCGAEGEVEHGVLRQCWEMFRNRTLFQAKSVRDLRGKIERAWIYNTEYYTGFGYHGSLPPDDVLQRYVDRLRKDRPYLIKALATYLVEIAKYLKRTNQSVRIPVLKAMGSRMCDAHRQIIEEAFQGRFWDDYGSAEFGSISCECPLHHGMHVFDDYFIVEITDKDGNPVNDGETGWIVVTDLMNRAMPMLRYRIGDVGKMEHGPCSCGLISPRLFVQGRAHDVLVLPSGDWLTHDQIVEFCEAFPGVHCCVVEYCSQAEFLLTVVSSKETPLDEKALSEAFLSLVDFDARIQIRRATTIPPESGGKFRFVRGNLMTPQDARATSV